MLVTILSPLQEIKMNTYALALSNILFLFICRSKLTVFVDVCFSYLYHQYQTLYECTKCFSYISSTLEKIGNKFCIKDVFCGIGPR